MNLWQTHPVVHGELAEESMCPGFVTLDGLKPIWRIPNVIGVSRLSYMETARTKDHCEESIRHNCHFLPAQDV
jgi:hypothetical protein